MFEVDVRRCRWNTLAMSAHPWPIFSPVDSIREAVPGQLADLSFVVLPRSKESKLNMLPWLGAAWYARPSVEWMLHLDLARWEDIKFSLQASAHVPPECLGQVLDIMEATPTSRSLASMHSWASRAPKSSTSTAFARASARRTAWATT